MKPVIFTRRSHLVAAFVLLAGTTATSRADWTVPIALSSISERYEVDANVAVDASGTAHLVYQDFRDYDGRYYYTNNGGGTWSANELVGTASGKGSVPIIVVTPDDMLHVFYGKNDLYWRTKPVIGGAWSTPVEVAINPDGWFINHAVVDESGGIYFMWGHLFDDDVEPRNGVWGRYKPLGGNWGATELVVGGGPDNRWHKGDCLFADGTTIWAGINYDGDCYFKKRPPGGPWPDGNGTYFHHGGGLRFGRSPDGNEIAAAYGEDITGDEGSRYWEVFVRYSYDSGNTWTAPVNISDQNGLDRMIEITYDASGNLHAAWQGAGCPHCTLRVYTRSRINGVWGSRVNLTPSNQGGLIIGALQSFGNTLHLGLSQNTNWWDVYYATNEQALPPPTPPVLYPPDLSNDPLVADDTIQHTLTLQASDINGASDMTSLRFLVNYQGDHAGQHRGYVAWGATPADIGRYNAVENWSIQPVDAGDGYWGIHTTDWGGDDYLTIRNVAESTFGYKRTVVFTFSVKPRYHVDGPLADNDISVFADDAASSTGWQNHDLNFGIIEYNAVPVVDAITVPDGLLLYDDATPYAITLNVSDGNGADDVRVMRCLINDQGSQAGQYRGYLAWGKTQADIGEWGGQENWAIQPVAGGEGWWGIRMNGWGADQYLTPLSATESHAGNVRTVVFDFTIKPQWYVDGPLTDNDISGTAADTYATTAWENVDLNFAIYPLPLQLPDPDRDTDIDQVDFGPFQVCLSGEFQAPGPGCEWADLDGDDDVDGDDVTEFVDCMSGTDIMAEPACLE